MKALIRAAFLAFCTALAGVTTAQHGAHSGHDSTHVVASDAQLAMEDVAELHATIAEPHAKFNPGEMIMGHVGDEHGWHLWGHTSLPLPIIVYNTERGFTCFSSGHFDHGHKTYGGYMLHEGKLVATTAPDTIDEALTKATWDISITKNVLGLLVSIAIMLVTFLSVAKHYRTNGLGAPKGVARFIEPIILFVRDDVAKANIGPGYARFMPYLLTVFFFILINNLIGLIPSRRDRHTDIASA